jgi:hypothetical protein
MGDRHDRNNIKYFPLLKSMTVKIYKRFKLRDRGVQSDTRELNEL